MKHLLDGIVEHAPVNQQNRITVLPDDAHKGALFAAAGHQPLYEHKHGGGIKHHRRSIVVNIVVIPAMEQNHIAGDQI